MFTLFDYQTDCLRAIDRSRRKGKGRALVVMASGLGKTVTAAHDVRQYREARAKDRVLYLCHQTHILEQARSTFEAIHGIASSYGYYTGVEKTAHKPDFLFASFQTMRRYKDMFRPDEFDYVVVDESHHTYADTYLDLAQYWRARFLLGLTATPDRTDGEDIRRVFGKEVFFLPIDEALAQGLLTPVDYRLLTDEIQLKRFIDTPRGRISIQKLNKLIFVPRRDEEIVKIIRTHASEFAEPRVIIFCESVTHCDHLARYLPDSLPFHSKIRLHERVVRLELFRRGIVSTLITVDVFNEGVDIPQANVLVFLRSTASPVVFFQQLGRGLRKSDGKDKVLALDFVGNCERIRMVYDLWAAVKKNAAERRVRVLISGVRRETYVPEPFALNVDDVEFNEKVVQILDIVGPRNFYSTWQDASTRAIALGIKSKDTYSERYAEDPRLPSSPRFSYKDFPGWVVFLGRTKVERYKTWQEAGLIARQLGMNSQDVYFDRKHEDPRLPGDPESFFVDWPGWDAFFGRTQEESYRNKDYYPTWTEAGRAARSLGIMSSGQYGSIRKEDSRLPRYPQGFYKNWPGWPKFLKKKWRKVTDAYPTWQQASKAACALGITSSAVYGKVYQRDPRLYATPSEHYSDFPGWLTFLGNEGRRSYVKNPYRSWQEAAHSAQALGIKSGREYRKRRCEDPRLYAMPDNRYQDFPGWSTFLANKK